MKEIDNKLIIILKIMKSIFASAMLLAATSFFSEVVAVEHAGLVDTSDYVADWYENSSSKQTYENIKKFNNSKVVDHQVRPVIGVLTEPFRGSVTPTSDDYNMETFDQYMSRFSYVPRSHVQFLEQSGTRVIPIDYQIPEEELLELLSQISGLYVPGDSHQSITDEKYKESFLTSMMFAEAKAFEDQVHFPVFLMGNSLQTYIRSKSKSRGSITEMKGFKHTNSRVELIKHPEETFFFGSLDRDEKQAVFNTA